MVRFVRPFLTLLLALFARPEPGPSPLSSPVVHGPSKPAAPAVEGAPSDPGWYEPHASDFLAAFERDRDGGVKQTWDGYWGWVRAFYTGTRLARGWNDRAGTLVAEVRSEAERGRLRARLNALGRAVAVEWARDYDVRRVGSADLLAWGKMMRKARDRDGGDGAEIHRTLDVIARQLDRKVGTDPIPVTRPHPEARRS